MDKTEALKNKLKPPGETPEVTQPVVNHIGLHREQQRNIIRQVCLKTSVHYHAERFFGENPVDSILAMAEKFEAWVTR